MFYVPNPIKIFKLVWLIEHCFSTLIKVFNTNIILGFIGTSPLTWQATNWFLYKPAVRDK